MVDWCWLYVRLIMISLHFVFRFLRKGWMNQIHPRTSLTFWKKNPALIQITFLLIQGLDFWVPAVSLGDTIESQSFRASVSPRAPGFHSGPNRRRLWSSRSPGIQGLQGWKIRHVFWKETVSLGLQGSFQEWKIYIYICWDTKPLPTVANESLSSKPID